MKTYIHDNGRKCILGPDGEWRHWDLDYVPGPREAVDWRCRMDHLIMNIKDGDIMVLEPEPAMSNDRGDFGMPTIGTKGLPPLVDVLEPIAFGPETLYQTVESSSEEWGWASKAKQTKGKHTKCIIDSFGISIEAGDTGVDVPAVTDEARVILEKLPYILKHFLEKNAQYARAQTGHDLGAKGVIPDINRKTAALITAIWDNPGVMPGDEPDELIGDLIGHLLLLLAKMQG